MRYAALLCCLAVAVSCSKGEEAVDTTAAAASAAPPPPPPIALADVAGKWDVKGMNEAGDSTLVTYTFNATADTTGWTIVFPNRRQPVPVRVVSVAGDSIVIAAGPYASVLRRNVQVRTQGPLRLKDGKLVGTIVARYSVRTADSVRTVRVEGTRAP